jgi:hypothetical protein
MGSLELRELLTAGGGISDIDLGGIFDPLRGNINELSAQSLRNQKANIGRAAEGAQDRAAEGLAGTGLGRSGVAAQQFQGIATRQQELLASAEGQVEEQRLKAMFQIGFKEAQAEHELALGDLNYTRQQIADALGFDRLLFQMQFQAEIDMELAAAQNDGGWFDDLIGIATAALPFVPQLQTKK